MREAPANIAHFPPSPRAPGSTPSAFRAFKPLNRPVVNDAPARETSTKEPAAERETLETLFKKLTSGRAGRWLAFAMTVCAINVALRKKGPEITVAVDNAVWDSRVDSGLERPAHHIEVTGFQDLGYQNEHVSTTLQALFGREYALTHIRTTHFTYEHLPLSPGSSLGGNEGGHCDQHPGRAPAEIVITIDGLGNATGPEVTKNLLNDLVHEGAHAALDPYATGELNSEAGQNLLEALTNATRDASLYTYTDSYQGPINEIARKRQTEFLAELTTEIAELLDDPELIALGIPWRERTKRQLMIRHNASAERVELAMIVTDRVIELRRDPQFWEKLQQGYRTSYRVLEQDRYQHNLPETLQAAETRLAGAFSEPQLRRLIHEALQTRPENLPAAHALFEIPLSTLDIGGHAATDPEGYQRTIEIVNQLREQTVLQQESLLAHIHNGALISLFHVSIAPLIHDLNTVRTDLYQGNASRTQSIDTALQRMNDINAQVARIHGVSDRDKELFYGVVALYLHQHVRGQVGPLSAEERADAAFAKQWLEATPARSNTLHVTPASEERPSRRQHHRQHLTR